MKKYIPMIAAMLCILLLCGCEAKQIKTEILEYVLQNKDSIEIDAPFGYQVFRYAGTGDVTSSVDYGYYYSENDVYLSYGGGGLSMKPETKYKNGYRYYGAINNDPTDWYYTEKICDNWYYYELHDG